MASKNKRLRTKIIKYLDEVESTNILRIKKELKCQDSTAMRLCFELLAEGYIIVEQDKYTMVWRIQKA